jgi:hypothetical protein
MACGLAHLAEVRSPLLRPSRCSSRHHSYWRLTLRQSRLRYSAVPRRVDRRTLLGGGGALLLRVPKRMCLVTNLVAHVTISDSPFDEFFTGAALNAAASGTAAVPLFVTNVTPQFRMGRIKLWQGGRRRSARFSSWTDRASASLRYFRRFSVPCWLVYFIAARVFCALCVGTCPALPCRSRLTISSLANVRHASGVDDFVLVLRWYSNCTFLRVTPDR